MRSLPTHLAKGLCVERPVLITKIEREKGEKWVLHTDDDTHTHTHTHKQKPFDMVVIAVPTEQTIPLLEQTHPHTNTHTHTHTQALRAVQSVPCLSIMVAYPKVLPILPLHTHTLTSDVIASARRDDTKAAGRVYVPGVAERWVIHATEAYTRKYIYTDATSFEKERVLKEVLQEFERLVLLCSSSSSSTTTSSKDTQTPSSFSSPVYTDVQRWMYSQTHTPTNTSFLWETDVGVGVCGDGWHGGVGAGMTEKEEEKEAEKMQGIERAWLSGRKLGEAILASVRERGV